MQKHIFLRVVTPIAAIGLVGLLVSLVGAWYVERLQAVRMKMLLQDMAGLQTAQDLEIELRKLRFHAMLYLMNPDPELLAKVQEDHDQFAHSLRQARDLADTPAEQVFFRAIDTSYQRYRRELEERFVEVVRRGKPADYKLLAHVYPIQDLVEPCQAFRTANFQTLQAESKDSEQLTQQAHAVMLFLGIAGPVSGLLVGYGIARGLHRSIGRLGVHVRDMVHELNHEVGVVRLVAGGDMRQLEHQLEYVVQRVREVTADLQRHQREWLRAEQLSAVGQLASGVAHEIRNPLTSMKVLVEVALRNRNPQPFTRENLRVLHEQIVRLEKTVQEFLDFARPPRLERAACDLRTIVEQAVSLIQPRAKQQRIAIELDLPTEPVVRSVDRGQLCTVLVNLCLNALESMGGGGRLGIQLQILPKGETRLSVADTGKGIAPEIYDRLFTPFLSTKPTGTGLGLCISQKIVENHGGRIDACNGAEGGASFAITLPSLSPVESCRLC